jgi:ATP-dependent DNA helicase RecG
MVVVNAERFGIASLHQLRGRVGHGRRRGLCILTGEANERTAAVCATADGFRLAEDDLRLRGAGELCGTRQSGLVDFHALDPVADLELLRRARAAVRAEHDGASPEGGA